MGGEKVSEIQKLYTDKRSTASFSGLPAFIENSKYKDKKLVEQQLSHLDHYTLHRPVRRHFPRRMYRVPWIGFQWGMDLMSTENMSNENNRVSYILYCQDMFSRYLWTAFLKSKSAAEVRRGLRQIFKSATKQRWPKYVLCDEGTEFWNSAVMEFMASKGVKMFSSRSNLHSAMVERTIRTMRDKLARYQTKYNTRDFIKIWPTLVYNFNHTKNRTTKFRPADVTVKNQDEVFRNAYARIIGAKAKRPSLSPGTLVRISRAKLRFAKSSEQSYTTEVFKIVRAVESIPVEFYYISDLKNQPIIGSFLRQELIPVNIESRPINSGDEKSQETQRQLTSQ
jgi:hypothetical protein